jgi:hypothetical protein
MLQTYVGFLLLVCSSVDGLSTVVYGPQSRELLLLTSKLAARENVETFTVCAPGTEIGCRRLMYGKDYADAGIDEEGNAKPISDGGEMQSALQKATCLTLVGYDEPVEGSAVVTLLESSGPDLSKIVLLSKMGITRAKGGFLGGGKDVQLLESEKAIRQICTEKNLKFSIVRAGSLKGGGPGTDGNDYGLSTMYYNSLIDSVEASVTMAHDRFTLGAECVKGDPVDFPNMLTLMTTKSSFDPSPFETNRIVAAGAAVAALLAEEPVEFTVSSAKGMELMSMDDWLGVLAKL